MIKVIFWQYFVFDTIFFLHLRDITGLLWRSWFNLEIYVQRPEVGRPAWRLDIILFLGKKFRHGPSKIKFQATSSGRRVSTSILIIESVDNHLKIHAGTVSFNYCCRERTVLKYNTADLEKAHSFWNYKFQLCFNKNVLTYLVNKSPNYVKWRQNVNLYHQPNQLTRFFVLSPFQWKA